MTTSLRLTCPSRLHFGLLARGPDAPRQFGGLGLMIQDMSLVITATRSDSWQFSGPLAERVGRVVGHLMTDGPRDVVYAPGTGTMQFVGRRIGLIHTGGTARLGDGPEIPPLSIVTESAPWEHVGLGSGTQVALGVAKLLSQFAGQDLPATELARITGRGLRSGVGLHGFDLGGLIVEGGHKAEGGIAPLLSRMAFPEDWSVLVVYPTSAQGLYGAEEIKAFASLPPIPSEETDRLCRLVLLGILPAVAERDLPTFGASLSEIQKRIGAWFAPAQGGGIYASPWLAEVAAWLESRGLHGVGQSSWGPTLYAFSDGDDETKAAILQGLQPLPVSRRYCPCCRQGFS